MNERPQSAPNWRAAATVALGAVAGLAAFLAVAPPTRTIERVVEIDAPPEIIWRLLTGFARYSEWNPFISPASGDAWPGAELDLTFHAGSTSMNFRPTVLAAEPGRELRWLGRFRIPRMFDGEHGFLIEPIGQYGVRVTQRERFTGFLVPFLGGLLRDTEAGFEAMNQALKDQARKEPWG